LSQPVLAYEKLCNDEDSLSSPNFTSDSLRRIQKQQGVQKRLLEIRSFFQPKLVSFYTCLEAQQGALL
ncbi:hypothetical protein ABN226_18655, partial [Morganella morganii]|uniref:hypothetical protein n=1 Tax=Morganella morganii TaxID=582 RepID=UPI0032DBE119